MDWTEHWLYGTIAGWLLAVSPWVAFYIFIKVFKFISELM